MIFGIAIPRLEPHIVIESSPGKYHRYWLVNGGKDSDKFKGVMETMIEDYGSDPNAKDVARVLRLAGFPHQKDPANPHMVTIKQTKESKPYTWDEITAVIPAKVRQQKQQSRKSASPVGDKQTEQMVSALQHINPNVGHDEWMKIGAALKIDGYPFEL